MEKETGFTREDYYATIPSLPLSYDAAKPILEAMAGPTFRPAGKGIAVGLSRRTGTGGSAYASLDGLQDPDDLERDRHDQGDVEPDKWVMVGNHRDAWVYGAVDPGSGTAATLEMARAIGTAHKAGWKPRRTLVYASWDAEEYGLVGSTEWCDEHAEEITQKAVFLLNVDSAVSGPELDVDGVPSLKDLILEAAGSVTTSARASRSATSGWARSEQPGPALPRSTSNRSGKPQRFRSMRPRSRPDP